MIDAAESIAPRRLRLRDAVRTLHCRLRAERDSPARQAVAVGLGVFLGCLPVYGLHLSLSAILAWLFGVNRMNTYLATWINNPLSAPFLLWGGFAVGRRLLSGDWPGLAFAEISRSGLVAFGAEVLLGSAVVGLVLAVALGALSFGISRRRGHGEEWWQLTEAVASRYSTCGIRHWEFVRGKLRHDPLYRELARRLAGRLEGSIVDLGCGRGIALAVAATLRSRQAAVAPSRWIGVEQRVSIARVAAAALAGQATIVEHDVRSFEIPRSDVVLLLDVLLYLAPSDQERLLARAAAALVPGGILLIREGDAAGGFRFQCTRASELFMATLRGDFGHRFYYRPETEWVRMLANLGLDVSSAPSLAGTPFSNRLIEARQVERP